MDNILDILKPRVARADSLRSRNPKKNQSCVEPLNNLLRVREYIYIYIHIHDIPDVCTADKIQIYKSGSQYKITREREKERAGRLISDEAPNRDSTPRLTFSS